MGNRCHLRSIMLVGLLAIAPHAGLAEAVFAEEFQSRLAHADLEGAESLARSRLTDSPADSQAQFALGTAQFLGAVEGLGQGLYRHGLTNQYDNLYGIPSVTSLPFLRLPVGDNPDPEPFTAATFRQILIEFDRRLMLADATLAAVPGGPVSLPLAVQDIALDFNGDGKAGANEALPAIIYSISGVRLSDEFPVVGFDESDVTWLRGYAHLLGGITDILLAHDWTETINLTFQSAFPASNLPSAPLDAQRPALMAERQANAAPDGGCHGLGYNWSDHSPEAEADRERVRRCWAADSALTYGGIGDLVAFIHLFRWPVVEPDRLQEARLHFLTMISFSRQSWASILAETDDDHEWVPSPRQTNLFPRMRVTDEIVKGWQQFLDQAEAVLDGKLLLPHWRFDRSQGLNLRRMLEEPRTLDPVLLLSGVGAIPYMEKGPLSPDSTLNTGLNLVEGGLLAYFLWFN